MKNKTGSEVTKGGKPVTIEKEDNGYYHQVAKQLEPLAETAWEDGENRLFIRTERLVNVFGAIQRRYADHFGIMQRRGFLKIKTSDPPGWYLIPEGAQKEKEDYQYPTNQLRKIAQRLFKRADRDDQHGNELRFMYLQFIQRYMTSRDYDPDNLIPQLVAKNYLVKRSKAAEPVSYYIFKTQKEGKAF